MKKLILSLAALLLFASTSFAISISGGNLVVGTTTLYDNGTEGFTLIDSDGVDDNATAIMFLENAGYAGSNTFGLYTYDVLADTSIVKTGMLEILAGPDSTLSNVVVNFDFNLGVIENSLTHASITGVTANRFGFYIGVPADNAVYYSHSVLNADGGADHFKTFDTSNINGVFGSNYVLAMEDLAFPAGDADFNDMVVGITDVAPVPEPATLLLLGTGLVGLAFLKRRKV